MYILRVLPQSLSRYGIDTDEKIRRKKKRVKALGQGLPKGDTSLYYGPSLFKRAKEFAKELELDYYPIEEKTYKGPDSIQIIMEDPQKMSQDIWEKTHTQVVFDQAKAVLTQVDPQGNESIQWCLLANNWIFFAYPEEILLPARKGTGISLQDLLLPKIEEGAKRIQKNIQFYLKSPEDIEAVHQYRVSIRAFRALISMVKPLLKEERYAKIQDIFRQKAQDGARLRELDVLLEEWDLVRREDEEKLKQALIKERKEEEKVLLAKLQDPKAEQELTYGVNQLIQDLSMTQWHSIDGIFFMDQRLHGWYRYTLEALWQMDRFDFPSVHRVRLKSKKYRYISEFFKEHMTQTQLMHYKSAKKRQKVLGEICDALRNQEAVEELIPKLHSSSAQEAKIFIHKEGQREVDLLTSIGLMEKKEDSSEDTHLNESSQNTSIESDKKGEETHVLKTDPGSQGHKGKKERIKRKSKKDFIIFALVGLVCVLGYLILK